MVARKNSKTTQNAGTTPIAKTIVNVPASEQLSKTYLEYAMSVVYSRAIPDAVDGMKPVHRRILYGMYEQGWTHDKNYVKVTRVSGHVMGVYHPHGDASIEDAIVKLAQPFRSILPLIDGYGNFGDPTGSPAAAGRYIECKLSKASDYLLSDLKDHSVDMRPTYDDTEEEPVVLPVRFPVLLVEGSNGIGVGFQHNSPSHNLREVIDATKYVVKNPNAQVQTLMKYIKGPDFSSGGEIIGTEGVQQMYETGQGMFVIRGKYTVAPTTRGKHAITFYELPYQVTTESLSDKIKTQMAEGRFEGIADIKDLTDSKNGLQLVIDVKAGHNPQSLVAELFKRTNLEIRFHTNNVALVHGEPRLVGLVEQLNLFVDHRRDVIRRRSEYRKGKRQQRLHMLEGLLKALASIDDVIKIVRNADDAEAAQSQLMKKLKIDEPQADYILSIPLRRLTKYDSIQLNEEKIRLNKEIEEFNDILSNSETMDKLIIKELDEVKKDIGADRKSEIIGVSLDDHNSEMKEALAAAATNKAQAQGASFLSLHASGKVTRTEEPFTRGRGKIDPVISMLHCEEDDNAFIVVSNRGIGYRVPLVHTVLGASSTPDSLGVPLGKNETLVGLGKDNPKKTSAGIAMGTKKGVVKIAHAQDFPKSADQFPVMLVDSDDEIIGSAWVQDQTVTDFVFVATDSSLLRIKADSVRPSGGKAGGVAGIKLKDGVTALGFFVLSGEDRENADVVTSTGVSVKRSKYAEYPYKGRSTGGVRSHAMRKGEGALSFAYVVNNGVIITKDGKTTTLPEYARRDASGALIADAQGTPRTGGLA